MSVRIVRGQIVHFNNEKGFGFAETGDLDSMNIERVFFRKEGARKVTGTFDEPVLTREPDKETAPRALRPNPIQVYMSVVKGDKGWKATAWGVLPKPSVQPIGVQLTGMLDQYVGGEVSAYHGHDHVSGKLECFTVDADELTLILEGAQWWDGIRTSSADVVALAYKLSDAHLNRRLPYGRLGLDADNHRLTFNLPNPLSNYTGD